MDHVYFSHFINNSVEYHPKSCALISPSGGMAVEAEEIMTSPPLPVVPPILITVLKCNCKVNSTRIFC